MNEVQDVILFLLRDRARHGDAHSSKVASDFLAKLEPAEVAPKPEEPAPTAADEKTTAKSKRP